jgi:hypothetical protein
MEESRRAARIPTEDRELLDLLTPEQRRGWEAELQRQHTSDRRFARVRAMLAARPIPTSNPHGTGGGRRRPTYEAA